MAHAIGVSPGVLIDSMRRQELTFYARKGVGTVLEQDLRDAGYLVRRLGARSPSVTVNSRTGEITGARNIRGYLL
jgi:hypothetical protein